MQFKEIPGNQNVKDLLIKTVKEGRISHAQMFLGETGFGGLAMALAYAQYINCKNRSEVDSCGECDNCRKNKNLEYPDVHFSFPMIAKKSGQKPVATEFLPEWRKAVQQNPFMSYNDWMETIDAENKQGNITAEECRDIIRKLALKPLYEGYKILIMWLPEYLGKEGNMLLKILEEPPENTLFLLVAEDENDLLPTIISRTQVLKIMKVPDEAVSAFIESKMGLNAEESSHIVRLSEGNLNTALRLCNDVENEYVPLFIQWMRDCFKPEMAGILKWVDMIAGTGRENQKNFLSYCINMFREAYLLNLQLKPLSRLLKDEADFMEKFSGSIGPANIEELNTLFSKAHYHIERNGNPKIIFFNLSLHVNGLLKLQRQHA